jgi:hypothetical protein
VIIRVQRAEKASAVNPNAKVKTISAPVHRKSVLVWTSGGVGELIFVANPHARKQAKALQIHETATRMRMEKRSEMYPKRRRPGMDAAAFRSVARMSQGAALAIHNSHKHRALAAGIAQILRIGWQD